KFASGNIVDISGVSDSTDFPDTRELPVTSVPTSTTFTYAQTGANATSSGGLAVDHCPGSPTTNVISRQQLYESAGLSGGATNAAMFNIELGACGFDRLNIINPEMADSVGTVPLINVTNASSVGLNRLQHVYIVNPLVGSSSLFQVSPNGTNVQGVDISGGEDIAALGLWGSNATYS